MKMKFKLNFQVWNQIRPPWLNALLVSFKDMMTPIVETLIDAVKVCFKKKYIFKEILIIFNL